MANSRRLAVEDALIALYAATVTEASVDRGWLTSAAKDEIVIGRARIEREFAGIGGSVPPHRETISVQVAFAAQRDTRDAANKRLDEMLEACETAHRADHTLGVSKVQWTRWSEIRTSLSRTDETPVAEAVVTVEAYTRP